MEHVHTRGPVEIAMKITTLEVSSMRLIHLFEAIDDKHGHKICN